MESTQQSTAGGVQTPEQESPGQGVQSVLSEACGVEMNGILEEWAHAKRGPAREVSLPTLPVDAEQADAAALAKVRAFFLGDPKAGDGLDRLGADVLPAALHPFRDPSRVRDDYPLALFAQQRDGKWCAPLAELLSDVVNKVAPEADSAKMLRDNLVRLELQVRNIVGDVNEPVDVAGTVAAAAEAMEAKLDLAPESAGELHGQLAKFLDAIPQGAVFLSLNEQTPVRLLLHAACKCGIERDAQLREQVTVLRNRLRDLLATERAKDGTSTKAGALAESVGATESAHVDPEALSRVLGKHRGSKSMGAAQRKRAERTVELFEKFLSRKEPKVVHVVHESEAWGKVGTVESERTQWTRVAGSDLCAAGAAAFDDIAGEYAELFGGIRIAQLELARAYEPSRHDAMLEMFNWRSFTAEELLWLPRVVVIESAEHLAGAGMRELSQALLSGRPLDIVVAVRAATDPGRGGAGGGEEELFGGYRFELAYLGLSHREALVNQSTAARPGHLMESFVRSLDGSRASLHVISSGLASDGSVPPLGAWLHGGAALEGRAHPVLHYDPQAGQTWARRLDFGANPQLEEDWPRYSLPCRDQAGAEQELEIAFTFADFAMMEAEFADEFRVVPVGGFGEELMPVGEYLALDADEAMDRIPYIWGADESGQLTRVVISRRLAFTCRDRLDYWRTLQELAGVRNEHVREAVERERERLGAEFEAQKARLAEEHAKEVERVESQAAGETMAKLAQALLSTDVSAFAAGAVAPASVAAPARVAPVEETQVALAEEPEAVAEEEDEEFDEPWIESALCTTCNDCMDINAQVFVYNANKQAVIADASAGTFDQIVRAAEKCPAKCIHPGKPQNADEPNLEELIERAKPFN